MDKWTKIPDQKTLDKTVRALASNGIETIVVENGEEAKEKILELLPKGAEIMNMTSVTLDEIGVPSEINESADFISVRKKLMQMDRTTQGLEMQKIGSAHEYTLGSVHAVTENGQIIIASNTGSQLPAYAYGASHVIWVVGAQKIVKNLDEGFKRIYEYVLLLESERAKKAYGVSGSNVSKLLIINKEVKSGRLIMILVKERIGF